MFGIAEAFENLTHLEHLRIRTGGSAGFPSANPATLHTFDFESNLPLEDEVLCYPHLETLRLKIPLDNNSMLNSILGDGTIMPDGQTPSRLKALTLNVTGSSGIRWQGDTPLLSHPRLSALEELELLGSTAMDISDTAAAEQVVALKHLRRLHLCSSPITGVGIKKLVVGLKGVLRYVTLTACEDVGHDAVEWAARQGVEVVVLSHVNGTKIVRR